VPAVTNNQNVADHSTTDHGTTDHGTTDHSKTDHGKVSVPRFVAPTHGGVDILKLLTELEDLVENTRHGPMGLLIGFPEDQFHMTIMKIRANLPEEMKRASKLAREQERIVEETRQYAEQMKDEARRMAVAEAERARSEVAQLREQTLAEAVRLRAESGGELARAREAAEREAQHIVEEARRQSEQLIEEARARATDLVDDNEIVQQAQILAQDLQGRTEVEATAVRRGADEYARDVLANLETILGKATTQVQRGRELLEQPRE
jgi:vacuolar-type H+-ATPase subunit H